MYFCLHIGYCRESSTNYIGHESVGKARLSIADLWMAVDLYEIDIQT